MSTEEPKVDNTVDLAKSPYNAKARQVPIEKLSPQNQRLVKYLQTGRSLSSLIALTTMGIGSVSKRVSELNRKGYDIVSTWKTDATGREYVSYSLANPEPKNPRKTTKSLKG